MQTSTRYLYNDLSSTPYYASQETWKIRTQCCYGNVSKCPVPTTLTPTVRYWQEHWFLAYKTRKGKSWPGKTSSFILKSHYVSPQRGPTTNLRFYSSSISIKSYLILLEVSRRVIHPWKQKKLQTYAVVEIDITYCGIREFQRKMAKAALKKNSESYQQIVVQFQQLRQEQQAIGAKIGELEGETEEHEWDAWAWSCRAHASYLHAVVCSVVIDTLKEVDPGRRCFRSVGGILVERTVGEVLPALQTNRQQVNQCLAFLTVRPTYCDWACVSLSLPFCLTICLSIYHSTCLSLSLHLSASLFVCLFVRLSVCVSVALSVSLSLWLSVSVRV